ncbi:MAG: beta-lactamase family protein [Lewinellaceae bacterium]|nr:beta-lactamase family protein [Lewinellaceae bacterium]MCB9267846.1 beta-lactamase family protein [Lewinellaceae bacterium]MCB9290209.1 beta-lactamase family protein [Lewinellaceae bacterium]
MKEAPKLILLIFLVYACQNRPSQWNGPVLTPPRQNLTAEELAEGKAQPLVDMSFFAEPRWGTQATAPLSGTLVLQSAELNYPKEKEYYPGENIFPALQLDFISHNGELIPRRKERIITSDSYWDVIVGAGKVWHEEEDGAWDRASFPLTLTDRWVGQARNCVATFVYKKNAVSKVCLQCSQETADIDDKQLGNISGMLPAEFQAKQFADSIQLVERHKQSESRRLPIHPLSEIDINHEVAGYFEKMIYTNAPTSLGAVWMNDKLYLHPPKTRHGLYPYPGEMRHGLYSVTKSMAGALALMYFAERYREDVFNEFISDYVPALANHPGWQGVTFSHTLNMATGTVGGEGPEHLFSTIIVAETAEEAINNVARLGDAPELPGQKFNYASTNLFVLSYALQKYVEEKEGEEINYWELVHENVLVPIGAEHFTLLHTIEKDETRGIPWLAYGALPTIDEAAKIALLFANGGSYKGQQILNKERVKEAFGATEWNGYSTDNDFRGTNYRHSFWSKEIKTGKCRTKAAYMLGFGENYVVFLPSKAIIFRFLDEHDLNIDKLIQGVENLKSSCREK